MKNYPKQITVRVENQLYKDLSLVSNKSGFNESYYVRRALRICLEQDLNYLKSKGLL